MGTSARWVVSSEHQRCLMSPDLGVAIMFRPLTLDAGWSSVERAAPPPTLAPDGQPVTNET